MTCVCTCEGKYRAGPYQSAVSEFDMTMRGLLGHVASVRGHSGAMHNKL